ncbi:MAG: Rrf2 family transcriptional regulator [Lachnospiraceae bacterium]|nr:Rrf2 family transcriptional regulator [Lachnospiraceae bacterium]MBR5766904.1 Rrf2 family transcriptional regulator [Lachnospiraceae bacterium]
MRVSTRVEYGLLALADIALYSENGASVSAPEISQREGISKKYLEQILPLLRQAGLIRAQKGLRGGYSLTRSADTMKMSEVLNALDNTILEEMDHPDGNGALGLRGAVDECFWGKLNNVLTGFAEGSSFSDFVKDCRDRMAKGWDMYVI